MRMIRLLLFALMLCVPRILSAQSSDSIYVSQFVKNSFTGYGVRSALVTVMDTAGCIIDTLRTFPGNGSHDAQVWELRVPRRSSVFRIKVEHPDYETGEMTVEMKHPARLNSFLFPDMLLKREFSERQVQLGEVEVRATRVQLCYKGDTIEVDARAFKLSEGSMLESLVKNVPGCELHDNGDIYMNGRKVDYLTLNGKDFFKGDNRMMLDNLPYYTVDKLQFFNQQSERSQLMGKDVERSDYVMNVKLKQEYSIGYLGNVEAGLGTHGRWLGRGFALRFTDNSRLSLFGNVNNINESRRPGGDGSWGRQNNPEGDRKTYNVGGELLVDDKYGRYKEVLNTSLLWSRNKDEQHAASQQFLQQGDVFGYSSSRSENRSFSLNANNHLTLKRIGLISDSRFSYSTSEGDALSRSAQLSAQRQEGAELVLDSVFSSRMSSEMLSLMVNSVQDATANDGHKWDVEQKLDYHKELPWGDDLMLSANGLWNGTKDDGRSSYRLRYFNGTTPDDLQERLTEASSWSYLLNIGANYAIHFLTGWHLNIGLNHLRQHSNERNDLYRLDWSEDFRPDELLPSMTDYLSLRDDSNSPHNRHSQNEEHITVSLHRHVYDSQRGRYLSFTTAVNTRYVSQNGTYTRGDRTVSLSDHRWQMKPSVDVEYQTRKWHDTYILHYDTDMQPLNLAQMADFDDTSNPLAVQQGNPNLRPSTTHNLSLTFSSRFGTHAQFLMLRSSASVMQNLVAINSVYDSNTGAYTFTPVNVNGNWSSLSSLNMRRALTEDRRLNLESRTSYRYIHGVDMKDNTESTVKQHIVEQNLKLEYKKEPVKAALLGGIAWHGVRLMDGSNTDNVDFNYGASLQANLPLKLHLYTDLRMYSRRGYADRSLCTDNLLWNLQIDRAFLHGRLLVMAKAFDLLHQMSSTHITVNSQGRTETWQLSLPSYFMLSVQYKFNKNPKKNQ